MAQQDIARSGDPIEGSERGSSSSRILCGWTLRERLGPGPVCDSWFAERPERSHPPGVVRVLREPFAHDPDARAEWLRASWAANRFEHARVVKVLEEGVDEKGAPVVVRRWIDGQSLAQAVARGRVDAGHALRIAEQLLDALEMAHAHGIAHGAITPSNIIVTPRGSIRLVDFATTPGLRTRRTEITGPIAAARLSPFAAPEQGDGAATEQADVWSVAACLRFALSGCIPSHDAATSSGGPKSNLDPNVGAILDLALEADPGDRYESAYAMLGDIRRAMAGRKPKLASALAPVPSQRSPSVLPPTPPTGSASAAPSTTAERSAAPASEPNVRWTAGPDSAGPPNSAAGGRAQWRGNLLLMVAIAVLVGVASFVMFREKLSDVAETHQLR